MNPYRPIWRWLLREFMRDLRDLLRYGFMLALAAMICSCSPKPGPCVLTACAIAAQYPGARILLVRYHGQPLGHAYAVYSVTGTLYAADWRGAVSIPPVTDALTMATLLEPPLPGLVALSAQLTK
jgi:hypothetical protein